MKKIILLVMALALVPAGAFGATMSLTAAGGSSALNIDKTVGAGSGSITVELYIGSVGDGVSGYTTRLHSDVSGVLDLNGRTLYGNLSQPTAALSLPDGLDNYCTAADIGATKPTAGGPMLSDGKVAEYTLDYSVGGLALGSTITVTPGLQGFAIPPPGPLKAPTIDGVDATAYNALTITITPEPMSAMLLLAAVPFLRRRRA